MEIASLASLDGNDGRTKLDTLLGGLRGGKTIKGTDCNRVPIYRDEHDKVKSVPVLLKNRRWHHIFLSG